MDRLGLIVAALALTPPCRAQAPSKLTLDHETVSVVGWSKDCSVAVAHLGFPRIGDAIADHPIMTRIGTLTIAPGSQKPAADWQMERDGLRSWSAKTAAEVKDDLKQAGYTLRGWHERLRAQPPPDDSDGLPSFLSSTSSFRTGARDFPAGFPGRWRLSDVYYSPEIASCGLLVFQDGEKPFYQLRLIRIDDPVIRKDRARAHLRAGRLLLDRQDRQGALAETAIAAELAPDDPAARYNHSLQLLLDGQTEAALNELEQTIKLDKSYKKKAREDRDFREWAWLPRFQDMTR